MPVSVRDVAQHAGVSAATVSNSLNHPEKVSPDARRRVEKAIAELGFIRNEAARQLREGRSTTIGLIVLDVGNPFFTDIARGAGDAGLEAGMSVMLASSDGDPRRESTYLDLFEQSRVAGVLISPYGDVTGRLERLAANGIRSVLVDRYEGARWSSVHLDDVAGGRVAVEHLITRGRRNIVFVGGSHEVHQVRDRYRGAQEAADAGKVQLESLVVGGNTVLDGREAGAALLRRGALPDGVFAANDLIALGVLQALVMGEPRIRVPEDIAIVGYDDIDFASSAVVPLTSVRQPARLMGRTAVGMLLGHDSTPNQVEFQPQLVVRESTGRV